MIDPTWAKGIDVSHWDAVHDFSAIPPDVVMFGAKATEGDDETDKMFAYHRDGARAREFKLVTYYHVAHHGDPAAHAQRIASVIGPLMPNECIVLDTERGSRVDIPYCEGFYTELEELGLSRPFDLYYGSAGVYTLMGGRGWPRATAGKVGLWAPRYKSAGVPPHLPPPWASWKLWQWTDGGQTGDPYSCPGVGTCDASVFNGTEADLEAFVGGVPG